MRARFHWEHIFGLAGFLLLVWGCYRGLWVVGPEQHMGDVGRIIYIHVPTAWNALLIFTVALIFAVASLWTSKPWADAAMVGTVEVGALLNGMLLVQGSIWARPTWNVWWTWDPRLTTSSIMFLLFAGILVLRSYIEDWNRRATWSAVATILAWVSVPVVYKSATWWRSLHPPKSNPDLVDEPIVFLMRVNAFAVLSLAVWFCARRARIETVRRRSAEVPQPPRVAEQGAV